MTKLRDVVIVGGGPVGLWLACELRLAGLDVVVLERRTRHINQSRGLTIHGRTLEVLSLRGIEDRFLAVSKPIMEAHYAVLHTKLDYRIFDSRFPFTLFIPQETTEALIEEYARELGVEIVRGATVEEVRSLHDHVEVRGSGDGAFNFTGRCVVGCDGAHSIVRSQAGIEFDGYPATGPWFLGDFVLGSPPSVPLLSAFNEHGCALIAPLGDGIHHRIVLNEPPSGTLGQSGEVTLEDFRKATEAIAGSHFDADKPLWVSRFDDETRLARHYRKGRLFLAGDAAHIHLPAGGQGMNVGIQDAMNLGWKLAAVIQGRAPQELLDTYESERRPVGEYLHTTTMAQGHLVTAFSARGQALRAVFDDMLKVPSINAYFANQVSGFGVQYPAPLPGFPHGKSALAGRRIRDIPLRLVDGSNVNLYALLAEGKWLDLAIDGTTELEMPGWLGPESLTTVAGSPTENGNALAGIGRLLVRPDGYVAQAIPLSNP